MQAQPIGVKDKKTQRHFKLMYIFGFSSQMSPKISPKTLENRMLTNRLTDMPEIHKYLELVNKHQSNVFKNIQVTYHP